MYITHDLWRLHGIPSLFLSFFFRVFLYISPLWNFLMRIDDNLLSMAKTREKWLGSTRFDGVFERRVLSLSLFPQGPWERIGGYG